MSKASQTRKVKKSMGKMNSSILTIIKKGDKKRSDFKKNLFINLA